jgi:hypothetical protein
MPEMVRCGTIALPSQSSHRLARMDEKTNSTILRVIQRAPQWLRHDLEAKEAGVRARAEETLAAMITDALASNAPSSD